jgi:hypothetical protein
MNLEVLSALEGLRLKEPAALEDALTKLLTEHKSCQPVTIKSARDRFSQINRRAKEGYIQVIKGSPGEETVVVSVRDLAAMIHAARTGVTLADVFNATGFKPVKGKRLVMQEGLRSETELVMPKRQLKDRQFEAAEL